MPARHQLNVRIARYATRNEATSTVDPLSALIVQLGFLTSAEYVAHLLSATHSVSKKEAVARSRRIVSYARTSLAYLAQGSRGPEEVAFLPAYYAALNLIKVCILFGKHHARLDQNRLHGAQYDVIKKDSRSLASEEVVLHPRGAIPLYYETITGVPILRSRVLKLCDIYCYIPDVAAEWQLATGSAAKLAGVRLEIEDEPNNSVRVIAQAFVPRGHRHLKRRELRLLKGFVARKAEPNVFASTTVFPGTTPTNQVLAKCIDPLWLYRSARAEVAATPIYSGTLVLFQELPILLALFHLSSVVRYKPEFLSKLRESKYGPVIATIARDAQAKLLYLIWSHLRAEEVAIVAEGKSSAV